MFTKKNVVAAIVCVLALTACSGTALADLIANGGLETGDFSNWDAIAWGTGTTTINSADPYAGLYAAQLTKLGSADGALIHKDWPKRDFGIAPGDKLHFSFAAKMVSGDANSFLNVSLQAKVNEVDGSANLLSAAWVPHTPGTGGYTTYAYDVTVPTDLVYNNLYTAFASGNSAGTPVTFLVDAVSVTIVPEPSTVALLAIGLLGLLCYAWRKRR